MVRDESLTSYGPLPLKKGTVAPLNIKFGLEWPWEVPHIRDALVHADVL